MPDWRKLFRGADSPASGAAQPVSFQTLSRGGRDWLVLPAEPTLAARGLALYPAQRSLARIAKRLLAAALQLKSPLRVQVIDVDMTAPFATFLRRTAGTGEAFPKLAIVSGNPRVVGRRFALLLFGSDEIPNSVVKAGMADEARALIRAEAQFIKANPDVHGMPHTLRTFEDSGISAFATQFIDGESPKVRSSEAIGDFLLRWVDRSRRLPIAELPPWQRLESAANGEGAVARLSAAIGSRAVHPVVWHGDFAPWNIKVSPEGQWLVFDWESGEREGVPGWDFIHYAVASGILVQRLKHGGLLAKVERLLASQQFQTYAQETGIAGLEREILKSYLLYSWYVNRPVEGSAEIEALLKAVTA